MAAGGLVYTASFVNVSVTNVVQNIWEMIAAAGVSILVHAIKLTFVPAVVSGIAQDVRAQITVQTITTTGSGGVAVTPSAVNRRNTVAAVTTFNRTVTTPGTFGVVVETDMASIIPPWERIYTPDQRIPVSGGARLALNLGVALGAIYPASSTIWFEEI